MAEYQMSQHAQSCLIVGLVHTTEWQLFFKPRKKGCMYRIQHVITEIADMI